MTHVVLFHSILGLRPAEAEIAETLGRAGHSVTLPDLFDGQTATSYDAAFAMKDAVGDETIARRAAAAVDAAPADAVLAGISFGAFLVGVLWRDRPQMPGALLISGVAPWTTRPRAGCPISVHLARPDPFDSEAFFTDWASNGGEADIRMHRYDGAGHYFLDRSLPDHDPEATRMCLERAVRFLDDPDRAA